MNRPCDCRRCNLCAIQGIARRPEPKTLPPAEEQPKPKPQKRRPKIRTPTLFDHEESK
jgi:hypothetical protein